jgi:hypothetical protein
MAGATGLEPATSCVTGRGPNQGDFDLVDGQRLILGAIVCLLGIPSKRGGNIPLIAFYACSSPSNSSSLNVGNLLDSWGDTALTVDHRSALKLKSLQVVERFGVPDGI